MSANSKGNETLCDIALELNKYCRRVRIAQLVVKIISLTGSLLIVVGFGLTMSDYETSNYVTLVGAIVLSLTNVINFYLDRLEKYRKENEIKRAIDHDVVKQKVISQNTLKTFCEMSLDIDGTLPLRLSTGNKISPDQDKNQGEDDSSGLKDFFKFAYDAVCTLIPGAVMFSSIKTLWAAGNNVVTPPQTWHYLTPIQKLTEGFEGGLGVLSTLISLFVLVIYIKRCCEFRNEKCEKLKTPLTVVDTIEKVSHILAAKVEPVTENPSINRRTEHKQRHKDAMAESIRLEQINTIPHAGDNETEKSKKECASAVKPGGQGDGGSVTDGATGGGSVTGGGTGGGGVDTRNENL